MHHKVSDRSYPKTPQGRFAPWVRVLTPYIFIVLAGGASLVVFLTSAPV